MSGEASMLSWLERPKLLVGRLLNSDVSASAMKVKLLPEPGVGDWVAVAVGAIVLVAVAVAVAVGGTAVFVAVGLGPTVGVCVGGGVLVAVGVAVGTAVFVAVGVLVEVGVGPVNAASSKAPMSHTALLSPLPSCGRVMPRWSVAAQVALLAASSAGLPNAMAWVWLLPPLLASGANCGLLPSRLPLVVPVSVQPALFWMRL